MSKFEVKTIVSVRKRNNQTEYLVEWVNTWEKESNLTHCKDLILNFKQIHSKQKTRLSQEVVEDKTQDKTKDKNEDNEGTDDNEDNEEVVVTNVAKKTNKGKRVVNKTPKRGVAKGVTPEKSTNLRSPLKRSSKKSKTKETSDSEVDKSEEISDKSDNEYTNGANKSIDDNNEDDVNNGSEVEESVSKKAKKIQKRGKPKRGENTDSEDKPQPKRKRQPRVEQPKGIFPCTFDRNQCDAIMDTKEHYDFHMSGHYDAKYVCPSCAYTGPTIQIIRRHFNKERETAIQEHKEGKRLNIDQKEHKDAKMYRCRGCKVCDKVHDKMDVRCEHIQEDSDNECDFIHDMDYEFKDHLERHFADSFKNIKNKDERKKRIKTIIDKFVDEMYFQNNAKKGVLVGKFAKNKSMEESNGSEDNEESNDKQNKKADNSKKNKDSDEMESSESDWE